MTERLQRGPVPLHFQLESILRNRIVSGDLRRGMALPTEERLVELYGVSRTVVRQAMSSLELDGLIERIPGKGTFVRENPKERFIGWSIGSLEDIVAFGLGTRLEVLGRFEVPASAEIAAALELPAGSDVVEIRGVRSSAEGVISFQQNFLLLDIGRKIADVDVSQTTIFSAIQDFAGVTLHQTLQAITAVAADDDLARLLQVQRGSPLLHIERLFYSLERGPVEFAVSRFRPDRYRHVTSLKRMQELARAQAQRSPSRGESRPEIQPLEMPSSGRPREPR